MYYWLWLSPREQSAWWLGWNPHVHLKALLLWLLHTFSFVMFSLMYSQLCFLPLSYPSILLYRNWISVNKMNLNLNLNLELTCSMYVEGERLRLWKKQGVGFLYTKIGLIPSWYMYWELYMYHTVVGDIQCSILCVKVAFLVLWYKSRIVFIVNNYAPKAKWILSNNPRDEVEGIIRQYSLSLRGIIVLV